MVLFFSEEFVAHDAKVNCLALGQISGRVLVTGGDDKKVNLWAIGTTNYVLVSENFDLFFFSSGIFFLLHIIFDENAVLPLLKQVSS